MSTRSLGPFSDEPWSRHDRATAAVSAKRKARSAEKQNSPLPASSLAFAVHTQPPFERPL